MARPVPPELHVVVSEADEVARQLKALGVAVKPPLDDLVFDALVAMWRDKGVPPRLYDIANKLELSSSSRVSDVLSRLERDGRVIHAGRGTWVPKVV